MTEHFTLTLKAPAHGGYCTTNLPDGKVALIRGGLPGEIVAVEISEDRRRYAIGEVVEVHRASADRQESIWPEATREGIGGADLAHVSPGGQSAWKEAVLTNTLARIGSRDLAAATLAVRRPLVRASDTIALPAAMHREGCTGGCAGSRTRFRTTADDDGNPAMYRLGSKDLVGIAKFPLAVCKLAHAFAHRDDHPRRGEYTHGITATGQVWDAPAGAGLALRETVRVQGRNYHYQLDSDSFWQAHYAAPMLLANEVVSKARESTRVLELYAGVGLFTVPLAAELGSNGLIRSFEVGYRAVGHARTNVNALDGERAQAQVRRARIDAALLTRELADLRPDVVIADPPRQGMGARATRALAAAKVPRIILVSCDVAAMARDLEVLRNAGYRIAHMQPFDLFDYTHHLEVVTVAEYQPTP